MRTDTENDTRHPGQEKWDCAESIHTEWGQIPRMTPASGTGEVGLCRVHTYRIGTDTENDTRHPGQEKWDCAESIHTEWGQIPRMTPGIQDRRSGTVQSPYIQNGDRYRE
ncbi:unnamed protein product [Staurois parvus]|uniref:Uncharacterized protein n=1 Tax=Staurois parvus TaxID=386267 RepID=A0ABN9H4F0_9NEOB|nr:unnamed protein product [Staurois parvus]